MTGRITVKRGSGNIFADLGFERPEEELLKAQLVAKSETSSSAAS